MIQVTNIVSGCRAFLRKVVKRNPGLRRVLLPLYHAFRHGSWLMRRKPVPIETKAGPVRMYPTGHIARVLWAEDFEREERGAIGMLLQPGMRVVNVGANAGLYALICGKIVGATGVVYAFEPASGNYQRLLKNISLNRLGNIHPVQCAVSAVSGTLEMHRDPIHPGLDGHYTAERPGNISSNYLETVPAIALDEYWERAVGNFAQGVDMMIIDVEGAELDVFKGAKRLIAASPNLLIMAECTKHLGEIEQLLVDHGFTFHAWDSAAARLVPVRFAHGNVFMLKRG